jgi:hypothetical protein
LNDSISSTAERVPPRGRPDSGDIRVET